MGASRLPACEGRCEAIAGADTVGVVAVHDDATDGSAVDDLNETGGDVAAVDDDDTRCD